MANLTIPPAAISVILQNLRDARKAATFENGRFHTFQQDCDAKDADLRERTRIYRETWIIPQIDQSIALLERRTVVSFMETELFEQVRGSCEALKDKSDWVVNDSVSIGIKMNGAYSVEEMRTITADLTKNAACANQVPDTRRRDSAVSYQTPQQT